MVTESFGAILQRIDVFIVKQPTNMVPFPIELHYQLGITLYRCSRGCRFSVVADLFSVSIALVERLSVPVCRELIQNLLRDYVKLPSADKKWRQEATGLI